MSFVIVSDSAGDFTAKQVEEMGIKVGTLSFILDGQTYQNWPDHRDMPIKEFYDKLRKGSTSSTAAVNVQQFIDIFEPILKDGKDVLYLGFSSGLSTTYQSGEIAATDLREKYPDRKILTVDTLSGSAGQSLLVWHACEMKRKGETMEEIAKWVEDNRRGLCHWVLVDDLHHLKRGGRVSAATAIVGSMLSIKPLIHIDDDGKLVSIDKGRGRAGGMQKILAAMEARAIPNGFETVFISHSDCYDEAVKLGEMIKEKFGTTYLEIVDIGPVIGSHTGPGTVVAFFRGNKR